MNPNTYWLFDTDEQMAVNKHINEYLKMLDEEEEDENAELTFNPLTINKPTPLPDGMFKKHLAAHMEAIKSNQKGSIKHLKKDESECEYHKWVHVGCSPFSGEQWFNCEHCSISKEKHEKNLKEKYEG